MQSTEHLLYSEGVAWKKIGEDNFDISVGSYSEAEISELVGLKILSELEKLGVNLGLYRDDGFGLLNSSGRNNELIAKRITNIFHGFGLKITMSANQTSVNMLDVHFNLDI